MLASATIRPDDRQLAERFTLKVKDLEEGWKAVRPRSTKLRQSYCSTAPRIQGSITGFSQSAIFREIDGNQWISSTTRVFPSNALARTWFNWSGGGALAACVQDASTQEFQKQGYTVSDLRRFREVMPLACAPDCVRNTVRAWRIQKTLNKPGDRTTWFEDFVAVRVQFLVITFSFESYDDAVVDPQFFVENVLMH
jgi:hypothetical protein